MMKLKQTPTLFLLITSMAFGAMAAEGPAHPKAGPNGGKLITSVEPHAEFLVNPDRKIEIRFLTDDNRIVAPGEQVVTIIMGDRSAPARLVFGKEGEKLISDKAIPEGNGLPTVLQIKSAPSAKAVTERFNLNLSQCPTCEQAEYACICTEEDHQGHDHQKQ